MGAAFAPFMLATGVVGAGLQGIGAYNSNMAASQNAAYQAQVASNNAKIAQQNAVFETQSGEIAATNRGLKTRAQVGTTLAQEGASGVSVNSGSFPQARAAESQIGMLDALTIRSDAAKRAYADETQSSNFQAESALDTSKSTQAAEAAPVAGFGSFLGSASSVGAGYYKYLQSA